MYEQDKAIVQSLVSVAWADGAFEKKEAEMLDALLESFGANEQEAAELRQYAKEKRTLGDIPLTELSFDDRRVLMQHAVILSWVDGAQHDKERQFLTELAATLRIPPEEASTLIAAANERAKKHLDLL
ncbi:MAG: TerB family tellurite resistance protein [Deltaproteobacteria bacterium]|nr:TerB family tellurite resistance protein [Deltaproteobacteria bacterium]